MLLSVPVAAQGNFPQGMGRAPGFPPQAGAPGKATPAGAKPAPAAGKANAAAKSAPAKNDKAALEAAKYQLSNHRTDLIKTTVDGYASSDDLSDKDIVSNIMDDIKELMPLIPAVPLEKADLKALTEQARKMVDQEYGSDDAASVKVVEAEAAAEYPLYKVGDTVVVNYNMGPKHFSIKGKLYRVTDSSITVEDKIINLVDLNDDTRARFDPRKNDYMRDRYKETHIHLINRLKIEKLNDYYEKLKGEIYRRNETAGYIYDPQTGEWATAQELAKNYIARVIKDKGKQTKPPKTNTNAQSRPDDAIDDGDDWQESLSDAASADVVKPAETAQTVFPVNDAIKLEDNAESQAKYKSVIAKAEKQQKNAYDNYAGIDTDCGYKKACWGFTIADTRYALWHEPEFPHIEPALGRDVIKFPPEGLDVGIAGEPENIDLVYVSNSLSKIVYVMKDCSRQDFLRFKDSLTEQYGHAVEDKGTNSAAFTNIFSGKTKPQQIADADEIKAAQTAVKDAEKTFNKAEADLKKATDDDRGELQEARDAAASALKEAISKAESFENAVSSDDLPYVYSRIELAKDGDGQTVLPYAFNWKGENVSGTLIFYYDKARDKVTSLVFAKEYKK
jgi:hypothetical protein